MGPLVAMPGEVSGDPHPTACPLHSLKTSDHKGQDQACAPSPLPPSLIFGQWASCV